MVPNQPKTAVSNSKICKMRFFDNLNKFTKFPNIVPHNFHIFFIVLVYIFFI